MVSELECPPGEAGLSSVVGDGRGVIAWPSGRTSTLRRSTGTPEQAQRGRQFVPWPRMKRKNRLTSATEFRRVRRTGKSYAHPLVLLIASPSDQAYSRYGVSASRAVGGAVKRNRAKRRMRAALREFELSSGWDLILVARSGLDDAPWPDVVNAISGLLEKAGAIG